MTGLQAIKLAATKAQVSFDLLRAICAVESGLDHTASNPKDGGSASHGLCQIKYATAKMVGYTGDIKGLYKPYINALYAGKYLKYQLGRYEQDWVKAVSAYNRGTYSPSNMAYVRKVFNHMLREVDNEPRRENQEHNDSAGEFAKTIRSRVR